MSQENYNQSFLNKDEANYVPLTPLSLFNRTCDIYPNRPAVIYANRQYSWSEIRQRAKRFASSLVRIGIKQGDTVSYIAANTPELFEAHFAVPMTGAVLNTINVRLDADTIAYILSFGDCKAVVCDTQFSELLKNALGKISGQDENIKIIELQDNDLSEGDIHPKQFQQYDYETLIEEGDENFIDPEITDEWQALSLNFTSGTSGKPKGVVYHHRGSYLMAMGTVIGWQLPLHPRYLYTVPMFHCNGWGHAWTMATLAATVICIRQVNAKNIFNAVVENDISHMGMAPVVLGMMVNADKQDKKTFKNTVQVMTAGAPPPPAILEKAGKLNLNIMQVYGLTETYGHVIHCAWQEKWNSMAFNEQAEKKAMQGVCFPSTEALRVVDVDSGEDIPRDGKTLGEILIRGNTIMKGYYKNIEATKKAFAGGWFHSGDLAVMYEDGYIEIKDRLKDIIISGGENISSIEVEKVLYKYPKVIAAAVVAMTDEKWGEVPCAFVELEKQASTTEEQMIAYCREHLAGFKCPKKIIFCELPKTATGKIQKFLLRQML